MTNRLSQVYRYDTVRWYCLIPDSICGMTSLVLALGVLPGTPLTVWVMAPMYTAAYAMILLGFEIGYRIKCAK